MIKIVMYPLWATIKKDWRILIRDRMGLILMFVMPIVLAIVITTVQNSTFELVNNKKIPLLFLNKDTAAAGRELEAALLKGGVFILKKVEARQGKDVLKQRLQDKEALLGMVIPEAYTSQIISRSEKVAAEALQSITISTDTATGLEKNKSIGITLYYHPVLQKSFRQEVEGALNNVLQIVQSTYIVRQLYRSINDSSAIPRSLEQQILTNQTPVTQAPVAKSGAIIITNATQHNIPAWTVFAMFFIVISLGANIVREKNSGNFVRLKVMPVSLTIAMFSKQITYIFITLLQAVIIFSIGRWVFPLMRLPALNFPDDMISFFLVIVLCGWCAASFATMIGVFAKTQEQSNGIGAVSVVLFAAIGGLLVPAFAMPQFMQGVMKLSPLYWCLEAFYGLLLEGAVFRDIFFVLMPIFIMILGFQFISYLRMRQQGLI